MSIKNGVSKCAHAREIETQKQRDRPTERGGERERDRQRERGRERETERDRVTERNRQSDRAIYRHVSLAAFLSPMPDSCNKEAYV